MASTYTLIQSQTLASTATSVTFSAIPSTYTDLVLKASARSDATGTVTCAMSLRINNATTGSSDTQLYGNVTTISSTNDTSGPFNGQWSISATDATSNTFGSVDLYIPNYALAIAKPFSGVGVCESNTTTNQSQFSSMVASLYNSTTAISSFVISCNGHFVAGSSFYLYGISNA